jgi:hypothetical protein
VKPLHTNSWQVGGELKTGLTWRVVLGLIFAVFLFIPVNTYSFLLTGVVQGSVAVFFIMILFVELGRISGIRLTKQEVLFLYYATSWGGMAIPIYYYIIYRAYFINSPLAWFYRIRGEPLVKYIPTWLAPPSSPAYELRTLLHPDFAMPLLVFSLWAILNLIADISLASISANIYVERLKYPFPLATVDSSMATFLGEREKDRDTIKYFLGALMVGTVFGAIVYLPTLLNFAKIIPIPFYDLTWAIQEVLPGGVFAILTIPSGYVTSMVVPFKAALWIFISSIVVWTFLNSLFVTTFTDIFPAWAKEYIKGMGLLTVQNRSYVRVWFGPQFGFMLAALIYVFLFKARKPLGAAISEILRKSSRTTHLLPASKAFSLFIISSLIGVIFYHFLIPEIPIWLTIAYSIGLGLFMSMTLTAILGETGYTLSVSLPWSAIVSLTPYTGYSGFVFSPPMGGTGSPGFSQQVKAAYMVEAKPTDLLKIWVLGFVLAQIAGFISLDFFWRVAPIPSSVYPYSVFNMLTMAFSDAMLSTRQMIINFNTVIVSLTILLIILLVGSFADKKGVFFSATGLIIGLYTLPVYGMAIFVGSLLGNLIMPSLFGGKERWRRMVGYVIAGELAGEGLTVMLGVVLNLISKSAWLWPW